MRDRAQPSRRAHGSRARSMVAMAVLTALVALFSAAGPVAAAEPTHTFRGTITGEKIGLFEQFKDTCGVTVDSKGDIYVADYYQNRVVVFNKKEEFVTKITGINPLDSGGVAPIDGPCDLAVDSAGRLYVSNYHHDVVSFTPGVYPPVKETTYGSAATLDTNQPTGIAVDLNTDDVYVDERTSIAVFDSAGTELPRIGVGSLADGYGVAVSGFGGTQGQVYVADAATNTVKVYDPAKQVAPIDNISGDGTPREGFKSLVDADLAIDPGNGHFYVADNLKPHFEKPEAIVYEFSATGHYRDQVPHPVAEGENSFLISGEGTGVAVGEGGNVYVTSGNFENAAVFVFGPGDSTPTHLITVSKTGTGSGTVFSSPSSLRCGAACVGEFNEEINVSLTAVPALHSRLVGWSGCKSNLTPATCQVTMTSNLAVSAEFEPIPQQTLTVAKSGNGSGTIVSSVAGIECGAVCESGFDEGSTVTLIATAAAGSHIAGWSGCDSQPTADTCKVAMSAARAVSARFDLEPEVVIPPPVVQQRTLTVASTGLGGAAGTVRSAPAGIDCGASCSRVYARGAPLTLTAQPAPGSIFLGWGGCEGTSGATCTLTLGSDRTVVAAFGPAPAGPLRVRKALIKGETATLTVAVPGPGALSVSGKWLRSAKTLPLAAGDVVLRVGLSPAGRRALGQAGGGRLKARAALAFAPLEGGPTLKTSRTLAFGGKGK
jgi:DNA-binding beta-propeller fold protein YncE